MPDLPYFNQYFSLTFLNNVLGSIDCYFIFFWKFSLQILPVSKHKIVGTLYILYLLTVLFCLLNADVLFLVSFVSLLYPSSWVPFFFLVDGFLRKGIGEGERIKGRGSEGGRGVGRGKSKILTCKLD